MRIFFIIITAITTALLWAATFLGGYVWIFDLIADGALYLVGILVVLIVIIAVYKAWKWAIVFLALLILYVILFVVPITLVGTDVKHIPKNPDLFFMNTLYFNGHEKDIIEAAKTIDPKTIALVEANAAIIAGLQKTYGSPLIHHNAEGLSCAIFSKNSATKSFIELDVYPICIAEFSDYTLIVVHPVPPYTKQLWKDQQQYFASILNIANGYQAKNIPVVIAGDMNSTWFSPTLREHFGQYKVRSFLSWWAGTSIALSLDHIIPMGKKIQKTYMLPQMTSDHRGLVAFF